MNKTCMYILIKDTVPVGIAVNSAAHASLSCYLWFRENPEMQTWLSESFAKKTCVVTEAEFARVKAEVEDHVVITESRLDNQEVALAFCPRQEYPKCFKFFPLFGKALDKVKTL